MLHESDLSEHGATGEGMIWIEHRELRSTHSEQANRYENCFFSCRFCNIARSTHPVIGADGTELLDPTKNAWAEHFEWHGYSLRPKSGDRRADYTWIVYKLDHHKKVGRRRARRDALSEITTAIRKSLKAIKSARRKALKAKEQGDIELARKKLRVVGKQKSGLKKTIEKLHRYKAVPADCPVKCRCGTKDQLVLPTWLERQIQRLVLPDMQSSSEGVAPALRRSRE